MMKNLLTLISWKMIFHCCASSFYLSLLATYSSSGNVMFVERMVTTWYLTVHIGFIFMALGLDLIQLFVGKSSKLVQYFTSFNNIIFISVVFPFGLFVPMTYWCLFYYNCNLILPNIVEITVPKWVSTSSHSVISLVAVVEMVTTKYTYKGNYILALTTMGAFSMSYVLCLIQTYAEFGFWVYPILHLVPEQGLWMVFTALATKLVVLFFFGAGISFMIHGDSSNSPTSKKSTSSAKLLKTHSVNPALQSVSDKNSDSSIDVVNPPSFSLESKSPPQKRANQQRLRDFTSNNGHKVDITSKQNLEVWHDAVYSPAIASFVEDSNRNVGKSKQMLRRKMHDNLNRIPSILKSSARDNQRVIQAPAALPARATCNTAQRSFLLTDKPNRKIDEVFRSAHRDVPMAGIPAPIAEDDIAMDSLEMISVPQTPPTIKAALSEPSVLLENKRGKTKKPLSARKEKSSSATVLFNDDARVESRSATNTSSSALMQKDSAASGSMQNDGSSSGSFQKDSWSSGLVQKDVSSTGSVQEDVSTMNQDKESMAEPSKSNANLVPGKKDKKRKKDDKGDKRISKDSSEKLSSTQTSSSDRWSYLEIASKRGIGKLDYECLEFETKSLPVDVDDEVGKKRDYRRDVAGDGASSSLML